MTRVEKVLVALHREGWSLQPSKSIQVPGAEDSSLTVPLQRTEHELVQAIIDIIDKENEA